MSSRLRQFLIESYFSDKEFLTRKVKKDVFIQIDDQDDNDDLTEFCNIFVTVRNRGRFEIELLGRIPVTQDIWDLAEIYGGFVDLDAGRIVLQLDVNQIEVLMDLARKIRKTSRLGGKVRNLNWQRISARTISSLYRFVRTIKEYQRTKGQILSEGRFSKPPPTFFPLQYTNQSGSRNRRTPDRRKDDPCPQPVCGNPDTPYTCSGH
jgi:hypothetical protein